MVGFVGLVAACSEPDAHPPPEPPLEERLRAVEVELPPPCDGSAPPTTTSTRREVAVRVAVGPGVPEEHAVAWLAGAAAVWAGYGVSLDARAPVDRVDVDTLLPATPAELERAVTGESDPEGAAVRALLEPARSLLAHRHEPDIDVDVILLRRLSPPDGVVRRMIAGLDGLTLAPLHLPDDDPRRGLVDAVGLATWTPTVFVGVDDVRHGGPPVPQVVAHELGHALGLPHVGDRSNLMAPRRRHGCTPILTDSQLDRVVAP